MPIVRVSSWRVIAVQLSVVKHLFTYLFENLEEPSTMPRPLTLTGITVLLRYAEHCGLCGSKSRRRDVVAVIL